MIKLNQTVLISGILAGIAAVFLTLGASRQPSLAFLLYAASAMPVFIAGLGWGNRAAITAVVTASLIGWAIASHMFALALAIFTLAPAAWLSHHANLARPASEIGGPEDLLAWYPLSGIILHLCVAISAAVIILGWISGYGPEMVSQVIDQTISLMTSQDPTFSVDAVTVASAKELALLAVPVAQGGFWVILLFAAYYFASRLVGSFGKGLRPRDDIPAALRMHRNAIFVFLASIVATFLGGGIALCGAVVAGTFGAGFLMSGFASLHYRTRGKVWRRPFLTLIYFSAVFSLPLLIILVIGMSDVRSTISLTPMRKTDTTNETNN